MATNVLVAVGFREYEHMPELPRGVTDIEAVAERFERDGFAVTAIPDRDREDLLKDLGAALRRDALDQPDTGLVVYWCGHATADAGAGGTVRLLARGNREDDPKAVVITADDLAELAALPGANQLLVLLDTCASGGALIDMVAITDALQRRKLDTGARWVGLVASCQPYARAVDGAMAAKLLDLLEHGPNDERLRERWNVYQAHLRGDDLVDALQKEWDEDRQTPKVVNAGNARAFIVNPLYNPNAPAEIVEHLRWASRGAAQTEAGNWFTGRVGPLHQIVAWMAAGEPGLCVLTGPAGCGKSAVAGRIVALSDREEREMIVSAQGAPSPELDPGEGSIAANIQARGLTLERCAEQLGDALGVTVSARTPNQHDVLAWASSLASPRRIVIDGLDEAGSEAFRIASELLAPLARYLLVMVASREVDGEDSSSSLISVLGPAALSIDLEGDPDATDRDVFDYVVARLTDPHGERVSVVMDPRLVAPQVVGLARASDQASEGSFLLARILTSQLLADPADTSQPSWQDRLGASVEEAFTRDLLVSEPLIREGHTVPQAGRELLSALAYSYGPGFPADDVWPAAASALSPTGRAYTREDVFWVLGEYGRYITASSLSGQAVYRLHQRIADTLRETEGIGALRRVPESTAVDLGRGLIHAYERLLETGIAANEHPYLWLYCWRHASDGGLSTIEELQRIATHEALLRPDVALSLNYLAVRYGEVGRRADAVAPAKRAVEIYEELAAENPAFIPYLARSLNNLGIRYGDVGRRAEAVAPVERAVEIYEGLAAENPAFIPDLAGFLANLGNRYSEVGRRADAVAPTERAVEIYERLVAENAMFVNDLAGSLNNLGNRYSEVGRRAEAVAPVERAVEIYEELAAENPAFLPDLASALNNLGTGYSEVGRRAEAVAPTERAVEIYEELAAENPALLPDLGSALNNLGNRYSDVGRRAEAVAPTERAVEIYEGLAAENPAFLPDLASFLGNLGNRYSEVGRRADAVAPTERAVEIYEELAAENPAFLNNLAGSLNNLGISYGEVGRRADSVAPTERAVGIYEELAAENPAFIPSLASSLGNLGNRYSDVGRRADAVAPTERAVGIYEGLAAENPVFLPDLARSLNNLATGYSETGDRMRGARRWDAVIERFHDDAHAGAVLRLRRARGADEFDEAIHDLIDADALAASLGRNWIVELHNTCRAYRERDPERVDALWETARGGVPDWLTLDDTTFSACADWLNTDTWAASRDYLVAHYQSILGHFGHTALAELALRYPDNPTIVDHQKLLETCGTDGIDAAYRPLLVGETVRTWRSLADPGEAKQYLLDNSDEILSKEGHEALANDLVGQAIITLARGSEIDLAYDLLTATDQTRTAMIADARRHAEALKLHSVATLCAAGTEDEQTLALAMTHLAIAAALNGQVEFSVELLREVRAARPAPDLISEITDAIAHRPADAAALAPLVAAISAP